MNGQRKKRPSPITAKPLAPGQCESTHRFRNAALSELGYVGLPRDQMGEDSCANTKMKSKGR
jgi:hypothetical protein